MPRTKTHRPVKVRREGRETAIVYCRVSTPDQVKNHSLGTQEGQCRSYCEGKGWDVLHRIREEGESAKTSDRTEFKKIIDYVTAHPGAVDYLVVADLSRFMRNSMEHFRMRAELAMLGVQLRCATMEINETPEGKLFETIGAAFSEYDNSKRRDKTVAGMIACVAKRRWPFPPPVGYRKVRASDGHPNLEPDDRVAAFIRQAFESVATGKSRKRVLSDLRAQGVKGRRNARFSATTLASMLRNRLYEGMLEVPTWDLCIKGEFEAIVP